MSSLEVINLWQSLMALKYFARGESWTTALKVRIVPTAYLLGFNPRFQRNTFFMACVSERWLFGSTEMMSCLKSPAVTCHSRWCT